MAIRSRYLGKGVLQAVENVNTEITEAIIGLDAEEQSFIDKTLIELGRHRKQRPLRCKCDFGGFYGLRTCGGGREWVAACTAI